MDRCSAEGWCAVQVARGVVGSSQPVCNCQGRTRGGAARVPAGMAAHGSSSGGSGGSGPSCSISSNSPVRGLASGDTWPWLMRQAPGDSSCMQRAPQVGVPTGGCACRGGGAGDGQPPGSMGVSASAGGMPRSTRDGGGGVAPGTSGWAAERWGCRYGSTLAGGESSRLRFSDRCSRKGRTVGMKTWL